MASNPSDGKEKPRRRLRIPAALAVALVGTSASVAMIVAGCSESTPDPVDAGQETSVKKDAGMDGGSNAVAIDAMIDGAPIAVDARPDARPDAYKPPVDAYRPPPDAPHT